MRRRIDRVGLRLKLRRQQAEAGDIVLLYADESEALTHPYLARVWAKRDANLRVPAPGKVKKVAMMGAFAWPRPQADRDYLAHQAQRRFHRSFGRTRPALRPQTGPQDQARCHGAR